MALIGTISGSNGTTTSAVTGSLIISDSPPGSFPALPSGVRLFVDGVISGSGDIRVTGNITGSNVLLTSGFIVTGSGIIESNTSAAAFRVTQLGTGNAIAVEDSTNPDSTPFVVTADGRVGIGTASPTSYMFLTGADVTIPLVTVRSADAAVDTLIISSSAAADGGNGIIRINQGNLSNKAVLTITNIGGGTSGIRMQASGLGYLEIGNFNTSPQISTSNKNQAFSTSGAAYDTSQVSYKFTELNKTPAYPNQKTFLISGNTTGHKTGSYFEVEKSGSAGSTIKILELQGDTTNNALFVSGSILTSGSIFVSGNLEVTGSTTVGVVVENLINSVGSTGTVAFDTSKQGIFYVNGPTGTITANFTNVPTTDLKVITPTVILSQSATAYSITVVQIDGAAQTLNWANGTTPTATANKQDVFGFSLIRSGSAWKVLGQLSTYG
jgi:hypothetical protein